MIFSWLGANHLHQYAWLTPGSHLAHTRLSNRATVIRGDAFKILPAPPNPPYDIIYIAPPQYKNMWEQALLLVDADPFTLLNEDGIAIVQIHPREFKPLTLNNLTLYDERKYGSTLLCFYERKDRVTHD